MQEHKNPRVELTEKELVLKQLEGVYRTTADPAQKRRVCREIKRLRESIRELRLILSLRSEYEVYQEPDSREHPPGGRGTAGQGYPILNGIIVDRVGSLSGDNEMNAVIAYADFFERNYLPILSEYYLKLDYNNSLRRDTFYPRYMEIKKVLKEYAYEVEVRSSEQYDSIASFKDKSAVHKIRYRYLLSLNSYLKNLREFLRVLVEDSGSDGTMLLNPDSVIAMSEFEYDRRLDGRTMLEGLKEMLSFAEELIQFLGMPRIKTSLEGNSTQWHR